MAGPLAGIRVVDLSQVVSGPLAGGWLADQGADVIKVEGPGGDPVRWLGPGKGDLSSTYISINRGKRAVAADLKTEDGRALVEALIRKADVLIENFRPGVLDKLGFGWDAAWAMNPRLIYCSITGYGRDGPYAGLRAYDPMIQASSGIAATQPGPDGEPQLIRTLICDKVTGLTAAQAITAALFARERSGEGQRIEVAMLDAALAFNWPEGSFNQGFMDEPPPVSPAAGKFTRLWKTSDGAVALASFQDHEFTALCAALNRPELATDERFATGGARARNIRVWGPILADAVSKLTSAQFMAGCLQHGAGGSVVHSLDEVLENPQVLHNGSIAIIEHGDLGRVRTARHPIRFSGTPVAQPQPAGRRGQHSDQVRAELGLPAQSGAR